MSKVYVLKSKIKQLAKIKEWNVKESLKKWQIVEVTDYKRAMFLKNSGFELLEEKELNMESVDVKETEAYKKLEEERDALKIELESLTVMLDTEYNKVAELEAKVEELSQEPDESLIDDPEIEWPTEPAEEPVEEVPEESKK